MAAPMPPIQFDPYTFPIESKKYPSELPVFIEVSAGSRNKYEWDSENGVMMLDRVLHSATHYPDNYGFIPQTLCGDGDPLDVLVMGTSPLIPGCLVYVRPVGYMLMEDEKGTDEKVLAVLTNDPHFDDVIDLKDVPKHKLREISHFFETYKQLEKNKWAKVGAWHGAAEALKLVEDTHKMYLDDKAKKETALN